MNAELTNAQRYEVQRGAGGVPRDAGDTQVDRVDGSLLVLVVAQGAPAARAPRRV